MQTAVRPPRPRSPRPPERPRELLLEVAGFWLRAFLIVVVIGAAALLLAALLLPAVAGVNRAVQIVDKQLLGQASADDVRFPRFPERSSIYASDGTLLATIYLDENRKFIPLRSVSELARQAVLAIEDSRFYEHGGVDARAILRALFANLREGEITQGGSTITQQLVKLQFTESEQTLSRKLEEASMALAVEQEYTKDEILELYVNKVYLGNGIYGIGTAAEYYFGKPARKLTVAEGALLAGMIALPETYNPVTNPDEALERRGVVIDRMAGLDWITEEEAAEAKATPIELRRRAGKPNTQRDPYFVQFIKDQILNNRTGEFDVLGKTFQQRRETLFQGGLKIYTTLNPEWQGLAEQAVRSNLSDPGDPQGAVATVETRTGAIRTLLSGADFEEEQLELAAGTGRQTGSAFKPFTLVAAFRQGFPPGKVYQDISPYKDPRWNNDCHCVYNAEGGSGDNGYKDLWAATQNSINVIFAQLALDVGAEHIVEAAQDLGITTPMDPFPAITLGSEEATPLDMASAFSTFANDGLHCETFAVKRIETHGDVLYRHHPKPNCDQVIPPDMAHQINAMLERAACCGTGWRSDIGRPQAGKTGTASDYTNAWFVGYIRQVSTAVWVGYARGQVPMDHEFNGSPVFGGTFPALIWHDVMAQIAQNYPVEDFPPPPPQQSGQVPKVVGLLEEEAEEILAEANFTPIAETIRGSEPAGTVIEQNPVAGTSLILGRGVHIFVSDGKGPPLVWLPNVVGLSEDAARARLESRGYNVKARKVEVSDPAQDGVVVAQSPEGGSKAEEGSTVFIYVGHFKATGPPGDGGGNGGGGGDGGGGGGEGSGKASAKLAHY